MPRAPEGEDELAGVGDHIALVVLGGLSAAEGLGRLALRSRPHGQ